MFELNSEDFESAASVAWNCSTTAATIYALVRDGLLRPVLYKPADFMLFRTDEVYKQIARCAKSGRLCDNAQRYLDSQKFGKVLQRELQSQFSTQQ